MGFLHKLWDETLAGPTPDSGLGKLRKYDSFSATRSPPVIDINSPDDIPISRSITILRCHSSTSYRGSSAPFFADSSSVPSSPAGPTSPTSPFSPTGNSAREDFKRLLRRRSAREPLEDPRSLAISDWVVMNALDH
ncbi:dormancy-associated protein homolog 4-like [Diospyros lotus]|uniref:dormancy-associated protein homolog 4-like n=1 Tax=Diospyros lotus TaxID=55363 RepID=UPI00225A2E99|nr:dormancy-associated protein homolog 4-like [Diospyros lotus]